MRIDSYSFDLDFQRVQAGNFFEAIDTVLFELADKGFLILFATPWAIHDAAMAIWHVSSASGLVAFQTVVIACAVLTGFFLARRAVAQARGHASQHVVPFFALIKQTAYEFIPIMVAVMLARVLLVQWLNLDPWAATFQTEFVVALVRLLVAMALIRLLFQPSSPALRIVGVDDEGAVKAVAWLGALFAFGHAHQVLLNAALRDHFPTSSAKSLTVLAALLMAAGAFRLFRHLRRHGLPLLLFRSGALALMGLTALWIWGVVTSDDNLFRGAIRATAIIALALSFDRMLSLSIKASRRPETMRRLFVLRVLVGAAGLALLARILTEFWFGGVLSLSGPSDQAEFLRRLNLAAVIFIGGLWLAALIHIWVEARIVPVEGEILTPGEISLRARLSTILPITRFTAISLILLTTALSVFSVVGIDITPLMGAAGILGLAISLGSQTLVKDIVSGLFYMFDDVFRVGETIQSNQLSGRIEQISTRAVRLRDAQGRVHTIAFGDLGTITNHSRRLVRVSVHVVLILELDTSQASRILRQFVSSLRSENLLQGEIIGPIETSFSKAEESWTMNISYIIGASASEQAEKLTQSLILSEIDENRISRRDIQIRTEITEIFDPADMEAQKQAS